MMTTSARRVYKMGGLAVSLAALALLATGCSSRGSVRPHLLNRGAAVPDPIKPGAFGDADVQRPAKGVGPSQAPGTGQDNHSDVASKTPDGGKSASVATKPAQPSNAPDVREGSDRPGSEGDRAGMDKAAADAARADQAGAAKTDAQAGQTEDADAAKAKAKPSMRNRPVDESDPSIGAPSPAARRKLT